MIRINIYIMTDLEGISGIYTEEQIEPNRSRFDEGRRLMTREINICAEACKAAGADKVIVRDVHGGSYTMLWDQLSPAVDSVVCGWTGTNRFVGLGDCDGVILLGYHAMAGAEDALLEHTMMRHAYRRFKVNNTPFGEIGIDSAILGDYQVPVIMVSGSARACAEAKQFLTWVTTVEVKQDAADCGAVLLSPAESEKRIRAGVKAAIDCLKNGKTGIHVVEKPVRIRLECHPTHPLPSAEGKPYMTVIDEHTYEVTGETIEEALWRVF